MEKVKVIQMGIGTVGQAATRSLAGKKGLDIVGAIDLDKEKVGKDLVETVKQLIHRGDSRRICWLQEGKT